MKRAALNAIALWAFLVVPSLCTSGLLTHACEGHGSEECGHQSDCHDDPCGKVSLGEARPARGVSQDWLQALVALPAADPGEVSSVPRAAHLAPQPHPPREMMPGAGLPLLI